MNKLTVKQISRIGIFTALTIVLSQISIPMPYGVPMTLQTFIIPLVALILGKKEGTFVASIYILLGLIGLPVFAAFSGGASVFFGPTGGFIFSFPIMAYCSGVAKEKSQFSSIITWLLLGSVINYLVGMVYFSFVTSSTLMFAFTACVLPFIPTAILKIILVYLVGKRLSPLVYRGVQA